MCAEVVRIFRWDEKRVYDSRVEGKRGRERLTRVWMDGVKVALIIEVGPWSRRERLYMIDWSGKVWGMGCENMNE